MKPIIHSLTCGMVLASGLFFAGCRKEAASVPTLSESSVVQEAVANKSFPNAIVSPGKYYLYSVSEAKYFHYTDDFVGAQQLDGELYDTPQKKLSQFKVILVTDSTGYVQSLIKRTADSSIIKGALQETSASWSYKTIGIVLPSDPLYKPMLFKFRKTADNHIEMVYADDDPLYKNDVAQIHPRSWDNSAELKLMKYQRNPQQRPTFAWDFVPVK